MRVLIDECLPRRIQNSLIGHVCQTVPLAGFAGKTNGELLTLAEQAGFEVLLTVDKGIQHQQNLICRKVAFLIVRARSNDIDDLLPHVPDCLAALRFIKPGEVVRVS